MKKMLFALTALATIVAQPALAEVEFPFYVGAMTGSSSVKMSSSKIDYKEEATSFSPVVGMRLTDFLRVSFEYNDKFGWESEHRIYLPSQREAIKEELKLELQSFMAQLYIDIPTRSIVTPFINAGVGATYGKIDYKTKPTYNPYYKHDDKDDDTSFAFNVGAGISVEVYHRVFVDVMYRFSDYGSMTFEKTEKRKVDLRSNEILVGGRWAF